MVVTGIRLGCFALGDSLDQINVVRELGETLFVGANGVVILFESIKSRTLSRIALAKVGVHLQACYGIREGVFGITLFEVCSRSVGVVDVVFDQLNCFGVSFDSFVNLILLEGSISLSFELLSLKQCQS